MPNSDARLLVDLVGQSANCFINGTKNSCRLLSLCLLAAPLWEQTTGTNSRTTYLSSFREKTKKACERRVEAPMDRSHMLGPTLWRTSH